MMLYCVFAILLLAVLGFLLAPLLRRPARRDHLYLALCMMILLHLGALLLYACFGSPFLAGR